MLFEAENISLEAYIPSERKELQGTYGSIKSYLNQGYTIDRNRSANGYWLLVKPARALIRIDCGPNGVFVMNMSYGIKYHYGRTKISQSLVDQFICHFREGRVHVFADNEHYEIR